MMMYCRLTHRWCLAVCQFICAKRDEFMSLAHVMKGFKVSIVLEDG
jgi:hypothetical protein